MAVTRQSQALLRELRTDVGELADEAVRQIAEAWLAAWDSLSQVWQDAVARLVEQAAATGRWPSSWQVARIPEVAAASVATQQTTVDLVEVATAAAVTAALGAVTATAAGEPLVMASQLPAAFTAVAAAGFSAKVNARALDAVRSQASERVVGLCAPIGDDTVRAAQQVLVRGTPMRDNPTTMIRTLLDRIETAFTTGRDRAATVARTETLDASRATAAHVHDANTDVLAGWTWWASLGPSCCSACWSMHGTVHPLDEDGPADHQQGRCVRLVRLKPWSAFGIVDTEPADVLPDAQARFRALSHADQLRVMGPARLALLDAGDITWADLAVRRTTTGWRDSYVPRTVADLRRVAGRRTP